MPEVAARGQGLRDWWIRNLDPSYRQIRLSDIASVDDLAAIAYDAGVQLGAAGSEELTTPQGSSERKHILAAQDRLEKRNSKAASKLVDGMLRG